MRWLLDWLFDACSDLIVWLGWQQEYTPLHLAKAYEHQSMLETLEAYKVLSLAFGAKAKLNAAVNQ